MKNLILFVLGIFLIASVCAIDLPTGGVSYCCEKTVDGAWCQNAPVEKCDSSFRNVPTSCEATSYCKLGTCYDSQEGTCMENTPEKVCNDNGGIWAEGEPDEVPQCQLGCCLIGDQAAFVTQTRCKRLSSLYGLEIDFRTSIGSEMQCIASATSDVKGACVFEKDFERTCSFITKRECGEVENSEFHEDYLCSADSLNTICGPGTKANIKTVCVEGRDEVYFVDNCGNLANIYDASRVDDKTYWEKIVQKGDSCDYGLDNSDSAGCGNCDYFLGSTCKDFKRSEDRVRPNHGDKICRDLSCEYKGEEYSHGETWCAESLGVEESLPGSRHFRLVCYNGDVTVEPCADFRQERCIQSEVNGFKTAACRVNMWQDCSSHEEKADCENTDKRDCKWVKDIGLFSGGNYENSDGACVPKNSPGFNFWDIEGEAEQICSVASTQCIVTYETGLSGGEKCVDNCECLSEVWENKMNDACSSLGDCGIKKNFVGVEGYHNESAFKTESVEEE